MTPDQYAKSSTRLLMETQIVYLNSVRNKRCHWQLIAVLLGRIEMIKYELLSRVPKEFSEYIESISKDNNLLKQ